MIYMILSKKMMCFALGWGIGLGASYFYSMNQNSVDQKIKCLKRKVNKLEKDLTNTLKKLKPEQMQKYKMELEIKLKEIKDKIENLTVKDIKDSAENAYTTIKQNINNLSHKISSLMNSNTNN